MNECSMCKDCFNIESSHDIPKYIGGKDCDGMRYLCYIHHREYDLYLLKCFLDSIDESPILTHWIDVKKWMIELKRNKYLHPQFKEIVKKVCKEYFDNFIILKKDDKYFCIGCKSEIDIEDYLFGNICPKCLEIINKGDMYERNKY